ncbi:MAG: SGNH/GDSL hydrolase family protein [Desulfobacterales bacterium]|nr:MAG: SGNH/GDSL hydrolase family protein [Desulfobacterales bacterium]
MKVILCYGDSNTYGRDPVTKGRLDRMTRWPGVLQKKLGEEYYVIEEGLNGRTTVWNDPVRGGKKRNGSLYLLPCLESHAPIDLLVIMLGTNDLKARFSVTPYDIGESLGALIEIAQGSRSGKDGMGPDILIMAPPPLGKLTEWAETFQGGVEKSKKLAHYYRSVASTYRCLFLDTSTIIQSSQFDGLHLDPEDHHKLGNAVGNFICDLRA